MGKPLDTSRILTEILAGQHDDRLADLFETCATRIRTEQMPTRWRMTLDDLVVTEDDLTLNECAEVENLCRVPWTNFRPQTTANQAAALLKVVLTKRRGLTATEADERIDKLTAIEVADLFDVYIAEKSPLDHPDPL